jgi:hypothetical protein
MAAMTQAKDELDDLMAEENLNAVISHAGGLLDFYRDDPMLEPDSRKERIQALERSISWLRKVSQAPERKATDEDEPLQQVSAEVSRAAPLFRRPSGVEMREIEKYLDEVRELFRRQQFVDIAARYAWLHPQERNRPGIAVKLGSKFAEHAAVFERFLELHERHATYHIDGDDKVIIKLAPEAQCRMRIMTLIWIPERDNWMFKQKDHVPEEYRHLKRAVPSDN